MKRSPLARTAIYLGAGLLLVVTVFPFYWMATASIKPYAEIMIRPSLYPQQVVWNHYRELFETTNIVAHFWNSLWTSVVATGVTLLLATLSGYAITRFESVSGELVARLTLFTYMIPSIVLVLPLFLILRAVDLVNTYGGLILSYLTFTLPFAIWAMRSYFQTIPHAIEEAALVDGANRFQTFFQVVLPQAIPGVIATSLFVFILCWGEYLYPLTLIATDDRKTMSVTLAQLAGGGQNINLGQLMAGSTMATLPILVLFLAMERYFIRGFAAGGID